MIRLEITDVHDLTESFDLLIFYYGLKLHRCLPTSVHLVLSWVVTYFLCTLF